MKPAILAAFILATSATAHADLTKEGFVIDSPSWLMESRIEGVATMELAKGADHTRSFTLDCTCLRDQARFDFHTIRYDNGQPVQGWRSILDGSYLAYQMPPKGKFALSGFFAADATGFVGAAAPSCLAPFLGCFAGDYISLSQVKQRAAKLIMSETVVDGVTCQRGTVDAPDYGHYEVSYDPAAQYLPRAASVRKRGHDISGPSRLDQGPPRTPPGSAGPTAVAELLFTLDRVRFDQVQGRWFPLSCRVTRVLTYADGNRETTIMQWSRSRLELKPALPSGAFKAELAQGARLTNLLTPHLPYQWKNGAAVPHVDPAVLSQMDSTAQSLGRKTQPSTAAARGVQP